MIYSALSHESSRELLKARFREVFGPDMRIFRAPGRVNLIGEHTDYNDGYVMPAAIAYSTHVAGSPESNRVVSVASESVGATAAFDLDALETGRAGDWTDYVRGVLVELQKAGVALAGAD